MAVVSARRQRVVVLGGGPGGYEAALVAAQLGAEVTVVDRDGLGGACVLTDCVPSKALIATADARTRYVEQVTAGSDGPPAPRPDLASVNRQITALATAQSSDIAARLARDGVTVVQGTGRLAPEHASDLPLTVEVDPGGSGWDERLGADVVLVATGSSPRIMPTALPDGERILTWQQIYELPALPERLIVVGSGVTGAELAHGYLGLGAHVTLVSSRDRVLPGEDADAAAVIEDVFRRRGMEVLSRSRAAAVRREGDRVLVTLEDGRVVEGSHCLLAVGSIPNTDGIGLAEAGIELTASGHVDVDRVSRTQVRGVYAAGDCTGVLPLASVAAMQGRIAMWHALGDAVSPINLKAVAANIFTDPEIATVGYSQKEIDAGEMQAKAVMLPLATNARAKMEHLDDGFVKLFARPGTGIVVGGVVVAPKASELIFPVALAVQQKLTVDQVASAFTIYPSLSGSVAEAARRLHVRA
jgi:NAD(P)H dehydrogenase (quinone)